jgi:hypothetical protein
MEMGGNETDGCGFGRIMSWWDQRRSHPTILGTILVLIGCFLPWKQEGDLISVWTCGIQIFPTFRDNGGLIVLIITIAMIILKFRPPTVIQRPQSWSILLCVILLITSMIFAVPFLLGLGNTYDSPGTPIIQYGLVLVCTGSLLILISSIFDRVGSRLIPPRYG